MTKAPAKGDDGIVVQQAGHPHAIAAGPVHRVAEIDERLAELFFRQLHEQLTRLDVAIEIDQAGIGAFALEEVIPLLDFLDDLGLSDALGPVLQGTGSGIDDLGCRNGGCRFRALVSPRLRLLLCVSLTAAQKHQRGRQARQPGRIRHGGHSSFKTAQRICRAIGAATDPTRRPKVPPFSAARS